MGILLGIYIGIGIIFGILVFGGQILGGKVSLFELISTTLLAIIFWPIALIESLRK